jgi:hypothetical protein
MFLNLYIIKSGVKGDRIRSPKNRRPGIGQGFKKQLCTKPSPISKRYAVSLAIFSYS